MRILKFLLLIFLVIFSLEAGSRIYLILKYKSPEYVSYGAFGHELHPYLGYHLKPNMRNVYNFQLKTTYSTNSEGLRGTTEYGPKKEGELRIAFLGESAILGHTATSDATSPGEILKKSLENQSPGKEISVLNSGTPGHISYQVLQTFLLKILPKDPDVLVIYTGWNDLLNAAAMRPFKKNYFRRYDFHYDQSWQNFIRYENARITDHPWLQQFALYLMFDRALSHIRSGGKILNEDITLKPKRLDHPEVEAEVAKQLEENLHSIVAIASHRKIRVIFLTLFSEYNLFPENRRMLNDVIRKVAKETQSELIDLDQMALDQKLQGINSPIDKYHITDKGSAWLAEKVSEVI